MMYQICTYLFSPRDVQGNKSRKDSWLTKKLTSDVRGKLFVITDIQVLCKTDTSIEFITYKCD